MNLLRRSIPCLKSRKSPQALLDEPGSPRTATLDSPRGVKQERQQHHASPIRSTSSSSSGSYDLEDAMPESAQTAGPPPSDREIDEGQQSSSGGYAESPPERHLEEERRRRKKTFALELEAGPSEGRSRSPGEGSAAGPSTSAPVTIPTLQEATPGSSPPPSHRERHRSRAKAVIKSQAATRSPQKEPLPEEPGPVQTSDDSSCSHHYHVHHHHPHHHLHREAAEAPSPGWTRHRRARESPRRKPGPHLSARRRSNEVGEEIVQPPAGFADSPEGMQRPSSKHSSGHRLFKKFDKRYRSEDRGERRHHRGSIGRSDVRAKSEERGSKSSPRYGEDFSRRRLQVRSTDASMEILTGREDEDAYVEPYTSGEWIYIGDFEESHVWKRPDSRDGDEDPECLKERRGSQESTESERFFRRKYQAATHRMVHRKSSGEMYKRIQTKCFESDKRVVVRREAGGEFGFRIHGSKPVVVSAIEPDTPAESSGLEVGDIVMSVNGKGVMEASHSEVVRLAHSGSDVLELEVARTCNVLAPKVRGRDGPREARLEAALCAGYLWRKARTGGPAGLAAQQIQDKWVRRWFALRPDNCLYYYKTDADLQPVGAVMLLKYEVELTHESRPHSFAIRKRGAPTLHLAADGDEAATRWTTVIREAVDRNNKTDTWLEASLKIQQVPACLVQRADCFGYLSKQQERVRRTSSPTGWSRRYCVLKDAALYFYEDAESDRAFGLACLHGFRVHGSAPNSGGRKHAFELHPPDPTQRTYTFATDSEMEKKRWLAALEYSIDRWIKIG